MLVSAVTLGILGMGGALAAGCTAGATTTTSSSPSEASTTDGGNTVAPTGPVSVDFFMGASQCLTPCPMGSPVLQGASITIEAVIENGDPTQQYSFKLGDNQSAYLEYDTQSCYCSTGTGAVDCTQTCPTGNKELIVIGQIETNNIETVSFNVLDPNQNVIGASSFDVVAPTALSTGVTNSLQKVSAGADGAFTVPAGAAVEITYAPVDASGTPLYFSQSGVSATFSSPDILGPTTPTDVTTPDAALGTGNVLFAAAGNAGDASIAIGTAGTYNQATGTTTGGVQATVNFHVSAQ